MTQKRSVASALCLPSTSRHAVSACVTDRFCAGVLRPWDADMGGRSASSCLEYVSLASLPNRVVVVMCIAYGQCGPGRRSLSRVPSSSRVLLRSLVWFWCYVVAFIRPFWGHEHVLSPCGSACHLRYFTANLRGGVRSTTRIFSVHSFNAKHFYGMKSAVSALPTARSASVAPSMAAHSPARTTRLRHSECARERQLRRFGLGHPGCRDSTSSELHLPPHYVAPPPD